MAALIRFPAVLAVLAVLGLGAGSCGSDYSYVGPPSPTLAPSPLPSGYLGYDYFDRGLDKKLLVYLKRPSQDRADDFAELFLKQEELSQNVEVAAISRDDFPPGQLRKWIARLNTDGAAIKSILFDYQIARGHQIYQIAYKRDENRIHLQLSCKGARRIVEPVIRNRMASLLIPQEALVVGPLLVAYTYYEPPSFPCVPPERKDPDTGKSQPGFGGMYLEDDRYYVYLLEPSDEKAMELLAAQWGRDILDKEVVALQGQYTWTELLLWYQSIESILRRIDGVVSSPLEGGVIVDPKWNRIIVKTTSPLTPEAAAKLQEELDRQNVPREAVSTRQQP